MSCLPGQLRQRDAAVLPSIAFVPLPPSTRPGCSPTPPVPNMRPLCTVSPPSSPRPGTSAVTSVRGISSTVLRRASGAHLTLLPSVARRRARTQRDERQRGERHIARLPCVRSPPSALTSVSLDPSAKFDAALSGKGSGQRARQRPAGLSLTISPSCRKASTPSATPLPTSLANVVARSRQSFLSLVLLRTASAVACMCHLTIGRSPLARWGWGQLWFSLG
jgi:hypothetical protein